VRFSVGLPADRVDRAEEFVTGRALMEMAAAAEAAGFDACYVTDHPAPDDRWLTTGGHHAPDPLVALSFAAAATTTLRLQTHVFIAAYRNPILAAKGIGNLDALSGGRVILGVAAGYLRPEFGALGVDFDERNELLDESIDVMRRVWTEDGVGVEGRHFRARSVTVRPRPASPGGPPIWVGGNSNQALRRAVERGQGWVPFPNPPGATKALKTPAIASLADLERRMETVVEHSAAIGRTEPLDVCFAPFSRDDDLGAYAALGVTWLCVGFARVDTREQWIEQMQAFATERLRAERGQ
jgi:probable F420-dependent oxidoreductase